MNAIRSYNTPDSEILKTGFNHISKLTCDGIASLNNTIYTAAGNIINEQQRQGYMTSLHNDNISNKHINAIYGLQHQIHKYNDEYIKNTDAELHKFAKQHYQQQYQNPCNRLENKLLEQKRLMEKTPWQY